MTSLCSLCCTRSSFGPQFPHLESGLAQPLTSLGQNSTAALFYRTGSKGLNVAIRKSSCLSGCGSWLCRPAGPIVALGSLEAALPGRAPFPDLPFLSASPPVQAGPSLKVSWMPPLTCPSCPGCCPAARLIWSRPAGEHHAHHVGLKSRRSSPLRTTKGRLPRHALRPSCRREKHFTKHQTVGSVGSEWGALTKTTSSSKGWSYFPRDGPLVGSERWRTCRGLITSLGSSWVGKMGRGSHFLGSELLKSFVFVQE